MERPSTSTAAPPQESGEPLILLRLRRRAYAIRLAAVAGLGDAGPLRAVPGSPPEVLGITEWRGALLTVFDLAILLDDAAAGAGAPTLIRLPPPHEQVALRVCASLRLGRADEACDPAERVGVGGDDFVLIEPARLLARTGRAGA